MHPRLAIANPIYTQLILQNQIASTNDPMPYAERALLLADALILCDQKSRVSLHSHYIDNEMSDPYRQKSGRCRRLSIRENRGRTEH